MGRITGGETRYWSLTLGGPLEWKALTPLCVRTPETAQLSAVPLCVQPVVPLSKSVL